MNEQDHSQWHELIWRRKLNEAETAELQKFLAAHPEAREELLGETGLNDLLERLPEAPAVSSNFTALVLQAVERDAAAQARERTKGGFAGRIIWRWLPKAAVAGLVLGFTTLGYQQYEARNRAVLARDVVALSAAVSGPDPELVKDLEPILRLSEPGSKTDNEPRADVELIALMK